MDEKRKKGSSSFNLNKKEQRSFDLEKKEARAISLDKETKPVNNGLGTTSDKNDSNRRDGKRKMWILLLFVVGLAIIVFFIFHMNTSAQIEKETSESVRVQDTIIEDTIDSISKMQDAKTANKDSLQIENSNVSSISQDERPVFHSSVSTGKTPDHSKSSSQDHQSNSKPIGTIANTALNGTIDELAADVIRGVYGNGVNRKVALGDRYAEIQKRVNEIYRMKDSE